MKRFDCLKVLAPMITDELMVVGLGATAQEWHALKPREANLFIIAMGYNTPVGVGLALGLPHRRVVVLDTDGSMLLNPGALVTVAVERPPNLTVVVFDNQAYERGGGLPTATARGADLAALARGAGIRHAERVRSVRAFHRAVAAALKRRQPSVVVARVERGGEKVPWRQTDGLEDKYRFARYVERTEGRRILALPEQ
ncbi:MAG: thiamine pyrophosphate-binding protein [Deltaproteobacteria bacterium]|nr:thiamine pyrophosphate-binding protein [Deltaproteobacteria bacterium]MBI3077537.1 thiamine pyrophosphate-binding protein [Deltaproteobacteria bacterium]